MGTMREKAGLLLMTVRLRVQLGRITEIETSYFRAGGGGPNNIAAMDNLKQPEALWLQPIPPAQRASRQQLVAIANAYFEAVQKDDGEAAPPAQAPAAATLTAAAAARTPVTSAAAANPPRTNAAEQAAAEEAASTPAPAAPPAAPRRARR